MKAYATQSGTASIIWCSCPQAQARVVWEDSQISGSGVAGIGPATGKYDRGRPYGGGSRPHVDQDPAKYAVSEVVGYLKGKSAIAVARQFSGRQRNFTGEQFWARGYAVSTVGFEEEQVKAYSRH